MSLSTARIITVTNSLLCTEHFLLFVSHFVKWLSWKTKECCHQVTEKPLIVDQWLIYFGWFINAGLFFFFFASSALSAFRIRQFTAGFLWLLFASSTLLKCTFTAHHLHKAESPQNSPKAKPSQWDSSVSGMMQLMSWGEEILSHNTLFDMLPSFQHVVYISEGKCLGESQACSSVIIKLDSTSRK